MQTFYLHPITAAIFCVLLVMGALGLIVVLPTATINFTWNLVIAPYTVLPAIGPWQSFLLYLALACIVYLSGLVHIEFKSETIE